MFKPQYSGERSRDIWKAINFMKPEIDSVRLHASFCLLQDMEQKCLRWLNSGIELGKREVKE